MSKQVDLLMKSGVIKDAAGGGIMKQKKLSNRNSVKSYQTSFQVDQMNDLAKKPVPDKSMQTAKMQTPKSPSRNYN